MLEYIFIAFVVIFSIQLCFYLLVFGKFSFLKKNPTKDSNKFPISIIICAKNEAPNLKHLLPILENQNYPNFEIVLINDCSTDDTYEVIENFKATSKIPTKIVNVKANEQFWASKKYAITLGIKAASYEHMLFSDADCSPASSNWATKMSQNYSTSKQLILGYGKYKKHKKSLLNKLIRFETLITAIQYFSYSKIGLPYMGVGRNIAYTKTLFFNNNGFVNHMKIKSGDADLFVNEVANNKNTAICFSENSFTISEPKKTYKDWIQQKRRHISTAILYQKKHKFLLGLFYISQLLFYTLSILLLSFQYKWAIITLLITLRFFILYFVIGFSAKKLKEFDLVAFAPFYEIFLIFIQMLIFIKNLISKPTHW